VKRGDVILCTFPHADTGTPKLRPALIVQAMQQIDECVKAALGIR
jgi:hypothetical protein